MIKALLDELKQKEGEGGYESLLNHMASDQPPDVPAMDFDRTKIYEYLKGTHSVSINLY